MSLEELENDEEFDDEAYSGGVWDKAAEIAVQIGLEFKSRYPDKFDDDEPVYAEDFGQELIYNALKYGIDEAESPNEIGKGEAEMNAVMQRISKTKKKIEPFDIYIRSDGRYSLNLLNSPPHLRYQEAFNQYAINNGESPQQNGFFTHGSGYEWDEVFMECFKDREGFEQIHFDSELGGFFIDSANYDLLEQFAIEFKAICDDNEQFTNLVNKALSQVENNFEGGFSLDY